MKDTLALILQGRMDKCQNEQYWVCAGMLAIHTLLITQKEFFLDHLCKGTVLISLVVLTGLTFYFIYNRKKNYYLYRKDLAELLHDVSDAPKYMKDRDKTMWSGNGGFWIATFIIILIAPIVVEIFCL
jgi:hypothetical protein